MTTTTGDGIEAVVPGTVVLEPGIVLVPSGLGVASVHVVVSGMRLLMPPVAEKFPLM